MDQSFPPLPGHGIVLGLGHHLFNYRNGTQFASSNEIIDMWAENCPSNQLIHNMEMLAKMGASWLGGWVYAGYLMPWKVSDALESL